MSGAYWLTRTCGCGRAIRIHREWRGLDYRATYYDGQQASDPAPITHCQGCGEWLFLQELLEEISVDYQKTSGTPN